MSEDEHGNWVPDELDPDALAEAHDEQEADPADIRPGVQPVDEEMIKAYVLKRRWLPEESAEAFSTYLNDNWFEYVEDPDLGLTNGKVVEGALSYWRGEMEQ